MNKIRVLIVDDSAVMREFLTDIISSSPKFEVAGTAIDPVYALKKINTLHPDIITLDIEMPKMDGLTFLSKIMSSYPMPVVMVSNITAEGSEQAIKAMQLGAINFIQKPKFEDINSKEALLDFTRRLIEKLIEASKSNIKTKYLPLPGKEMPVKKIVPSKIISERVIAIGSSAGGVPVLFDILSSLGAEVPAIVIAQHMPGGFTRAFADRINMSSKILVKEAEQGDRLYSGTALIAPGNRHMLIRKTQNGYMTEISDDPPFNRHKPSVDKLFYSVSESVDKNAFGIILTGMGDDGAKGLLSMLQKGATTIAQDRESSMIFGMPLKAIEIGAAQKVMNIAQITQFINSL